MGTPAEALFVSLRANRGCRVIRLSATDWMASILFFLVLHVIAHQDSEAYIMTARTICRKIDSFVPNIQERVVPARVGMGGSGTPASTLRFEDSSP